MVGREGQEIAIDFPILGYYDQQRFVQFNPSDSANWYLVSNQLGKKKVAMYPTMGRRHINFLGSNRLVFEKEPRGAFKSINYAYFVVSNTIYRVDRNYNVLDISTGNVTTFNGDIFFTFLVAGSITFSVFVDGQHIYVYREDTGEFSVVTDGNSPGGATTGGNPKFVATFGNRIVVSVENSSAYYLSQINMGGSDYDPGNVFTVGGNALFNQASGIIRQFGVLHNTLYIFTDYSTDIWSNIPSVFTSAGGSTSTFPWKINTTTNFDYGMADPKTLSIGFGRMVWMAQNEEGLVQVVQSSGQAPKPISTKAIDTLFQKNVRQNIIGSISPFLNGKADGFLYQWENTIFYRLSAGLFENFGVLDITTQANSIEYNFDTDTWHRVIESNGERNRIQKHVFFNNTHLVTVTGDNTVYEMSGQFYDNEITNPDRDNPQSLNAYIREPFRYERVTPIISEPDYAEFITDWVEIDFVWGLNLAVKTSTPFENAVYLIDEHAGDDGQPIFLIDETSPSPTDPIFLIDEIIGPDCQPVFLIDEELGPDGEPIFIVDEEGITIDPIYLIAEEGNTPTLDENFYNNLFRPYIELFWSDDGAVSFLPAGQIEFSQLGQYQWRMRWYQLGPSRNRAYKLACVSNSPIVLLGGIMMTGRVSDGTD